MSCMRTCDLRQLHTVTYENGLKLQQRLAEMRQRDEIQDQLLLLEHPPVITLGRGGDAKNLLASPEVLRQNRVRFFETTRGGDITYHGPGQIVGYPIVHLGEGNRDVRKYVTNLEEVLIRTMSDFEIDAFRIEGLTGVHTRRGKIAAIGVHIARWVTTHGFALNVNTDLRYFDLIIACDGEPATSMEELLGTETELSAVEDRIAANFTEVFSYPCHPCLSVA